MTRNADSIRAAGDSAVTGYLVEEVLNAQPIRVRDVLLSTSILEQVSADAARELTGHEQAGQILPALARANAFVQPAGGGWYRYHPLFAEVLRLRLRREHPGRVADLHRRAARWYEQNGSLADAVRHAAAAGDWPLAARVVVDGLAIGEIAEPWDGPSLADHFQAMPHGQVWTEPAPYLVLAAAGLSAGQPESSATALEAAEGILEHLPAGQGAGGRLAAAMIRLTTARRTGDLAAAATAIDRAEALVDMVGWDKLAQHPQTRARVLFGRGAVALWSGHLDEARRALDSGVAVAAAAGREHQQPDCLGYLAVVEALRGQLGHAAQLAAAATAALTTGEHPPTSRHPNPASLVALAWVRLERGELREAHRLLNQADTALGATPDKIIAPIACLAAAHGALANGDTQMATQIVDRARSNGPAPAWLDHRLSLAESRAFTAAGDTGAALAAARRAGGGDSPEAAVTLAHAWIAAGDGANARRALEPAQAARDRAPERVRLQAWLADAQISYHGGDRARGRRSLASALRLAEREQLRLPLVMERGWIVPVLRQDPALAEVHRRLLAPAMRHDQRPAPSATSAPAPIPLVVEPLTERERDVLRQFSGMLNTAEVASEMHISVNTVKTHLKSIYRKLSATHCGEAVRRARQLELI